MLQELRVSNFAIIDNLQISFRGGLNVLSGETGAGKSILLKSLGLLMGDKADASSIRTGAETAVIEGAFDISHRPDIFDKLQKMGVECADATMVVRRLVTGGSSAKARVYINGALSTLSALRDVVSPLVEVTGHTVPLIEMTGQHDNRSLLAKSYHLELLDQYAGTTAQRGEFERLYHRRQEITSTLDTLRSNDRGRAQKLDFLVFSRDEIRSLGLVPGDEIAIESEAKRIKYAARLMEFSALVDATLESEDDSILARLKRLISRSHELRTMDPALPERLAPLEQASLLLRDVAFEMRNYGDGLDADPERLDALEARLSRLRQLQKKYGQSAESILQELEKIENEICELESSDERIGILEAELTEIATKMTSLGQDLHRRRREAAVLFTKEVNAELLDLNMKGVEFLAAVELLPNAPLAPQSSGFSDVEFMTKTSRGDVARALAKAASGGELSRILLSIKRVVGTGAHPRTYLFDEVDAGVSGETAEKVGRKLKEIANGQQVICVTHLPQVACCGDVHFFIEKSGQQADGVATMRVSELPAEARVTEIARLISGEKLSPTSIAHAKQLLGMIHDATADQRKLSAKEHASTPSEALPTKRGKNRPAER